MAASTIPAATATAARAQGATNPIEVALWLGAQRGLSPEQTRDVARADLASIGLSTDDHSVSLNLYDLVFARHADFLAALDVVVVAATVAAGSTTPPTPDTEQP